MIIILFELKKSLLAQRIRIAEKRRKNREAQLKKEIELERLRKDIRKLESTEGLTEEERILLAKKERQAEERMRKIKSMTKKTIAAFESLLNDKKGNAVATIVAFITFAAVGVALFVSFPAIDTFRIAILNSTKYGVGVKLIMYALFPIIIGFWILFGVFGIRAATRRGMDEDF